MGPIGGSPLDILERIIGRLRWVDRSRIRAVCKAWPVPNTCIPAIVELPWAMKFCWRYASLYLIQGECRLLDPLSREYLVEERSRGLEYLLFRKARPCASLYGWVLFKVYGFIEEKKESLFLYSPLTTEVIRLPYLGGPPTFQVATFALNATSPKCTIFLLWSENGKICIKLCSAGDCSWKTLSLMVLIGLIVLLMLPTPTEFSIVFLEEVNWVPSMLNFKDLQLLSDSSSLELLKLDFAKMNWVYENDLNNRCCYRIYGSTSPRQSRLYRKCVEAAKCDRIWIELPLGGIWRADDLIHAV
ncbi:hypothetical protein F3Y22_tig00111671pilonHSYRG00233 [Hibiscus syriacus]|uniref:F-box domain-containing protein n=1 Tax=Hibiscus syriacus TaxID=106335 RepID=A0A6A2XYI8_HIBSY|nr:hypothetical protein F3Y22_tig00111671pilonHSYRG00233 [Hibiscus syriacus]